MPEAGSVIGGKYRLRRRVGEGAMASVWSAVHETLGRPVAVKFIHAKVMENEVSAARFMQEARIAASVQHRFVVDIFDFGKTERGEPYMVMELLNGETLADRITNGPPIPVKTFVRMVEQCLTGLEAVHGTGIVHRDLKPENVFLIHDGDGGFPKLLDFGISRVDESVVGEKASRLTREGAVLGTPWYMSPEQVRGKADLDHRTDLYSMGVILYEVLSGLLPFDSDTVGDLMVMIATETSVPVAALRPDLPESLSDVIEKAMSKEPGDRFQSAKTMRMALRRVRQDLPDDAFTIVTPRAPSDPPQKLGSQDLLPAAPRKLRGATTGRSRRVAGPDSDAHTMAPPPDATVAEAPESAPTGILDPEPRPRSRGAWLVAAALLIGVVGVGVGMALREPTERGQNGPEALPLDETPSQPPEVAAPLPPEVAEEPEEIEAVPPDLGPPEAVTMAEAPEPAGTSRRRRRGMRRAMRADNPEHFDDPGF